MRKNAGFTMAELLIVVAIISVLVSIAIPVFGAQLQKAKLATDVSNVRAKFAEIVADKLADGDFSDGKIQVSKAALSSGSVLVNESVISFADGEKITISRTLGGSDEILVDSSISFVP